MLKGNGGDDTIDGGADQSANAGEVGTLTGGEGNDTLVVDATGGEVVLNPTGGVNVNSSGFENLTGGPGDDMLAGNDGDNVLDGLAGANQLDGGDGDDIFVVWGSYMTGRPTMGQTDTIADFTLPDRNEPVMDVIHLRGFSPDAVASDTETMSQIMITDGAVTQIITLTGVTADDDLDDIVGDGRGSEFMIFMD